MSTISLADAGRRRQQAEVEAKRKAFAERGADQCRFKPIRFADITLTMDPTYLVKGLVPREGLIVVWGPPKCGKSFLIFDLVMHVALGMEYRERRVQQGVVVYIAAEGERGLAARAEAYRQTVLSEDADPDFYLLPTRLDLVEDAEELISDIRKRIGIETCAAVVIDTLNRTIAGSESKDEDMSAYVKAADKVREAFQAAVIIIHHCGINGERPRGHTSLTGACDAQLAVRKDEGGNVVVDVEHMKDGAEGDRIISRLRSIEIGTDSDGEIISSCVIEEVEDTGRPAAVKEPRMATSQRRALQMLFEAVNRVGEVPPYSSYIPVGASCVSEDDWRRHCYEGGVSGGDQEAKRRAFIRAADALIASGKVGKWGTWVWPVL